LAPERSVGELALPISPLLGDRALRLKLGQRARQLIERRFDMQQQTAQLEDHYRSTLK
jgi:hypothetical protein